MLSVYMEMTHHSFTVMAEVKLNASHQELLKDRIFLRGGGYPGCLFLRATCSQARPYVPACALRRG